jgi:hypothetical protein
MGFFGICVLDLLGFLEFYFIWIFKDFEESIRNSQRLFIVEFLC